MFITTARESVLWQIKQNMFLIKKKPKAQTMWIILDLELWCWSLWNKTTAYRVVIICCCKQKLHCNHQRFLVTHFFPIFTPSYESSQPNCGILKQKHVFLKWIQWSLNGIEKFSWHPFILPFPLLILENTSKIVLAHRYTHFDAHVASEDLVALNISALRNFNSSWHVF